MKLGPGPGFTIILIHLKTALILTPGKQNSSFCVILQIVFIDFVIRQKNQVTVELQCL